MTDESSPWSPIHKGIDLAAKPSTALKTTDVIGWVYEPKNLTEMVTVKAKMAQEMLESLSIIGKDERAAIAAELTLATMYGDLAALDYVIHYLRLSLAIKGKGRDDILKLIGGTAQKISVPTTMQKIKRTLTGGKGKNKHEETENQEVYGYGESE